MLLDMCVLQVVSAKSLLAHADGLRGVYGDILRFIPDSCSLLLEVTRPINSDRKGGVDHGGGAPVKGFNFLVNSVWPEIVSVLERKASVIFAPGNPDTFHKVRVWFKTQHDSTLLAFPLSEAFLHCQ